MWGSWDCKGFEVMTIMNHETLLEKQLIYLFIYISHKTRQGIYRKKRFTVTIQMFRPDIVF